ncbi:hypothetical protein HON52_03545 [Candidatus Uhrbacteria bacterium]|nr:hypothetical protein [Candidatus Uhrbacteria bacterium]
MTHKKTSHRKRAHKKKPSREEEQELLMEEGLEAIYGKKEDIDFSKLDHDQDRLTKLLIRLVVGLGLVATMAWSGFFVFMNYVNPPRDETFTLEILMDETLVSGEATTIEILYTNPTTVPIAALSIDVNLPSSFVISQTNQPPTDTDQLIWDLGELTGLSDNHIVIEGTWFADTPSETPIQAYATYRPGNFNSEFEEIAVAYVTSLSSVLELSVDGPEELAPGETGAYAITLINNGELAYEEVDISLDLPDGFYLESSEPELEAGSPANWTIETIDPELETTILFEGSFAADIEGFQYFDTLAYMQIDGRELLQTQVQNYTDVLRSDVSVSLAANGATDTVALDQDGTLRVSLGLEQSGSEDLEDYSVLLSFESEDSFPINWSSSQLDGGTLTQDGIAWSAEDIGAMASGVKELLNLSFPIEAIGSGDADQFEITALFTTADGTVRSSPITVSINSEAELATSVRYFNEEGQALGSGPIPPVIDEETSYRVYWVLENDLHTLKDIRVSATLPPHVTWSDKVNTDLGDITFDSGSSTVSWTVAELSTAISHLEGYFTISITPDVDDIGSFVKLTSSTDLLATDTVTGTQLHRAQDNLTTEAPDDEFASGQGIVVE